MGFNENNYKVPLYHFKANSCQKKKKGSEILTDYKFTRGQQWNRSPKKRKEKKKKQWMKSEWMRSLEQKSPILSIFWSNLKLKYWMSHCWRIQTRSNLGG